MVSPHSIPELAELVDGKEQNSLLCNGGWNLMVFDETIMFWGRGRASGKGIVSTDQDYAHHMETTFYSYISGGRVEVFLLDYPLKALRTSRNRRECCQEQDVDVGTTWQGTPHWVPCPQPNSLIFAALDEVGGCGYNDRTPLGMIGSPLSLGRRLSLQK